MSDDLVTWLRDQLDDDTAEIAKHPDGEDDWLPGSLYATREQNYPCDPYLGISKRRALAEVDAKRRILDLHGPYPTPQHMASGDITACSTCGSVDDSPVAWPCPTVRLLALPCTDRPGYRDEWKP